MMRTGIGYDIHRLSEGRPMMIGGVSIPYHKGTMGHSDGDALLHAVCDAVLGALSRGDIGDMFPDSDDRYKGAQSRALLSEIVKLMDSDGYDIVNLDCIVVLQEPKLGVFKEKIRNEISGILGISCDRVNVKAKTNERLGEIGAGDAAAAYAAVLLKKRRNDDVGY
ncbi:MAG: 2-C-methyl-D-erythritol 2,4-cyclodiphosphate synthase [Candidatus Omnitrophota bacterium]